MAQTMTTPETIRAKAEADRLARDAEVDRRAREAEQRLRLARQQAEQRRAEERAKREEKRTIKAARRAERSARRAVLADAVRAFAGGIRRHAPRVSLGVLAGIPIVAPMIVAWTGQVDTATSVLHWPTAAGVVFAAAWESVGILAAALHHLTRTAGDRGTVFRFAAWVCAAGAAAMNYGHRADQWQPTTAAVAYGAMSLVSLTVWELCALYLHRKSQQSAGRVSPPRPHFGFLRWMRFTRLTWTAWSLALRDDIGTVRAALDAAAAVLAERDAARQAKADGKAIERAERKAAKALTKQAPKAPAKDTHERQPKAPTTANEQVTVNAPEGTHETAHEASTDGAHERPLTVVRERLRSARKTTRKPPTKTTGRLLLGDYVNAAREHLTPDAVITPAWVRQVTGCSRGISTKVAAELNANHNAGEGTPPWVSATSGS